MKKKNEIVIKRIISIIVFILLIIVLFKVILKVCHIKTYRQLNSLIWVKEQNYKKEQDLYDVGDKVVLKERGNYVITNIRIDHNDGTYITMVDNGLHYDEVGGNRDTIMGLLKAEWKDFYAILDSWYIKLLICTILIAIVLRIRTLLLREEDRADKTKNKI